MNSHAIAHELSGPFNLESQLWREVGQHLELQESLQRIAPIVRVAVPIDAMLVRRIEHDPTRLTTIAFGACDASSAIESHAARSECDAAAASALADWLRQGNVVRCSSVDATTLGRSLIPADLHGTALAAPLLVEGTPVAVLLLFSNGARTFGAAQIASAQSLIEPLTVAFENDRRLQDLARMREALEADRAALLTRLERQDIADIVVGASAGLRPVMQRVEQVARTDAPVLILGETGSGKEVIARAIHARSRRAAGPVVRVNCGAISPELIDSELFGHERGSFTGAVATRKGWFERADGGTLFLDEIGELPPAAQVRLLRVLQDGSLERVGGHQALTVDVRIVAATHRDLESMVPSGSFREDLWYRISVFPIRLPALRERPEDIGPLSAHFASRAGRRLGGAPLTPSESDVELLCSYAWPGNVRELGAVIERAVILGDGKRLEVKNALGIGAANVLLAAPRVPDPSRPLEVARAKLSAARAAEIESLEAAMRRHIERSLEVAHGQIEGPAGAAVLLAINPHTLRARMRKLGIDWSRFRPADGAS